VSHRANRNNASHWAVHSRWLRSRVPAAVRSWLLEAGSLTDRLRMSCKGCFSVRVLDEGWQRPRVDEADALGMRFAALGWVREVQLLCDGEPQVFARTIVPRKTLSGAQRQLAHLGNRPLGAYLFADPSMRRSPVELACIRPGQAMFAEATAGLHRKPLFIWGRRSVFRVSGKPLLVTEVFLPAVASVS
jgi:chorismate--pyruvate lyase